jgi:hypothetical protein
MLDTIIILYYPEKIPAHGWYYPPSFDYPNQYSTFWPDQTSSVHHSNRHSFCSDSQQAHMQVLARE